MIRKIITLSFLAISNLLISQNNLDLESGNTAGWTISGAGGASIVSGGNDAIGGFPRVFPGGAGNSGSSMLLSNGPNAGYTDGNASQSFVVTPLNACLIVRYAVVLGSPGHGCAACSPQFNAGVFLNGNPLPCSTINQNAGCSSVGWSNGSGGSTYLPWTITAFDLRPFIGSNVEIRINTIDCCGGAHWAYSYVDCTAQPMGLYLNGTAIPSNQTNSYLCNGVNNVISAPPGFAYLWNGPGVNGVTTQSINAVQAGTYSVNLSTPGLNCAAVNLWSTFGFIDTPIADFNVAPVCYGSPVSFTNTSITPTLNTSLGVATTYSWNFDDGTPLDNNANPNHLYLTANPNANTVYNVELTAASQNCTHKVIKQAFVGSNPIAGFNSNIVCFGSGTQITGNSDGNGNALANYAIDFNFDGSVDAVGIGNPVYTFPYYGDNAVSYTVSTNPAPGLTCYHSTANNVWVDPLPEPNFSFVNNCVNAQPNTLDASISTIPSGTNDVYDWNFGDGQTANLVVPTTSHIYGSSGTYQVNLTVTSDKGCAKSISHPVEVYAKPMATILASSLTCLGGTTTFTANTTGNSGNIVQWEWDVNNTIASKELNGKQSAFVFPSEGLQTINLVATTDHGCQESFTRNVYINYLPKPEFVVDNPNGCMLPLTHCVNLDDNSVVTGPAKIINWNWNFGNGNTRNETTNATQNNCYTNISSTQSALYTVTLTTKTDSGCVASVSKKDFINVYPKPVANYTIVPEFGTVVVPLVHFINQSIDYDSFIWHFGDGNTNNTTVNPDHEYETVNSDDYYSSLIVKNQYNCTDTAYVKVNIAPEFVFYIPNTFTPNADGVNDGFTGKGIGIVQYKMWIYNRWGTSIYYTDDINKAWTGQINGTSNEAQQDVYTWKVELKDVFGKSHDYVGHVTLLR